MIESAKARPVVLVIDDDEANRKLLNVLLRREGIHPIVFERGEEGLNRLREETPDLVLLDVFLPDQDGFQILKRIKSNPKTADVPVVMFTVLGHEQSRLKALEMGACAYVTKPFDMNRIVALIRELLSGGRSCGELGAVP